MVPERVVGMVQPVWYGTQLECEMLLHAIANNCACEFTPGGSRTSTCGSHRMLTSDQRALNGLLFVRNIRDQLLLEEWGSSERNMARSGAVASSST